MKQHKVQDHDAGHVRFARAMPRGDAGFTATFLHGRQDQILLPGGGFAKQLNGGQSPVVPVADNHLPPAGITDHTAGFLGSGSHYRLSSAS
ncbi:hypothetical protein [Xenorhabdus szentirmaii]|uniref:hypothetical protein n=1 Tax=Xenorhabdus szentirmaii TaxID=290112 RepID=UPI001FCAF7E1|nr:hypothetical protein [Xenorhabdus szentirmaii]